jgi:hypothetical protein
MTRGPGRILAIAATIVTVAALVPVDRLLAQSINQRKTTVNATIVGSRNLYDGTFVATGTSSICGEIPKESSMTGTAVFVIEYPSDDPGNAPVQSIAFGSTQLVGAARTASLFRLSIAVRTPDGGTPHAYVLNTDPPGAKTSGMATLSKVKNQLTLKVRGQNEMKETIDLTIVCS